MLTVTNGTLSDVVVTSAAGTTVLESGDTQDFSVAEGNQLTISEVTA